MVGIRVLVSALALGVAAIPASAQMHGAELNSSAPSPVQAIPVNGFRSQFQLASTGNHAPLVSTLLLVRRDSEQLMTLPPPSASDGWQKVLIALALVAYQLRRKHRSLRTQPFGL